MNHCCDFYHSLHKHHPNHLSTDKPSHGYKVNLVGTAVGSINAIELQCHTNLIFPLFIYPLLLLHIFSPTCEPNT